MKTLNILLTAAALSLTAGVAFSATAIKSGETSAGTVLTDGNGMSLYTFDKDTAAVSNCNGDCADKWPPVMANKSARPQGKFGIILRADGDRQWTYQGQPLYAWFKDAQSGDITGDGVKGVWHLARP